MESVAPDGAARRGAAAVSNVDGKYHYWKKVKKYKMEL